MQRKYIYIIVFILTIALVLTDYYVGLNTSNSTPSKELLEIEDAENQLSVELKSDIVIKNSQNDDRELVYTYKLKIDGLKGAQLAIYDGKETYIIFTANGEAEITIDSNKTMTISDILQGTKYSIEQTTDVSDKYNTKTNKEESTKIEGIVQEENIIEFSNETIKSTEPVKKNPYTNDNHYLFVGLLIYSIALNALALNVKTKRFE
jgi:hypothetical protein